MSRKTTRRHVLRRLGAGTIVLTTAAVPAAADPPSDPGGGKGGGNSDDTTDPTIDSLDVSANDTENTVTFTYEVSDNNSLNEVGYYIEKDKGKKIVDSGTESVDGTSASGDITTNKLDPATYDWRFYVEDDANNRTYQTGQITVS